MLAQYAKFVKRISLKIVKYKGVQIATPALTRKGSGARVCTPGNLVFEWERSGDQRFVASENRYHSKPTPIDAVSDHCMQPGNPMGRAT